LLLDDSPAVDPDYPGVIYLPDGRVIEAPSSSESEPQPEPSGTDGYENTASSY
jgi:hypothetical protein